MSYETILYAVEGSKARLTLNRPEKLNAQPREIATMAVYLASDAAEFSTGQVVWVEGGALSHV